MKHNIRSIIGKISSIRQSIVAPPLRHLHESQATLIFSVVFFLWTFTSLVAQAGPTNDGSWKIGLNWALANGWQWGQDIMYTYGPLYWLHSLLLPVFFPTSLVVVGIIGFNLAATFSAGYIFSKFVPRSLRLRDIPILALVSLSLLLWNPGHIAPDLFLIAILVFFVDVVFQRGRNGGGNPHALSLWPIPAVLALSQFVKVSFFSVSAMLFLYMAIVLFATGRKREGLALVIAYPVFSLLFWWGAGQSPANLPDYFRLGLQLSAGYSDAMQKDFTKPLYYQAWIFILILLLLYGLTGIRLLWKKQFAAVAAWFLPLPLFFLSFKEGFVRADGHVFLPFMALPLFLAYLLYVSRGRWPSMPPHEGRFLMLALSGIWLICLAASHSLQNLSILPVNQLDVFQQVVTGKLSQPQAVREPLVAGYVLEDSFLDELDPDATTDIIPNQVALLYGYGINWLSRPQFQSYTAFTPVLDGINAGFFYGPEAPEQVIWQYQQLDTRYQIFDEPLVFRSVLDRYRFVTKESSNRFVLLRLDPQSGERPLMPLGGPQQVRMFEEVVVPEEDGCHVFMTVQIQPNFLWNIFNVVYKAPYPFLVIRTRSVQTAPLQFVRIQGSSGLFVSKFIYNAESLRQVVEEKYKPDVHSVTFLASRWFYSQTVTVQFFSVPFRNG